MKKYVYTDLSVADSLYLEVGDVRYEVAQFNASWACNEIPSAQCLLATGRSTRGPAAGAPASVHRNPTPRQMTPARVWFEPKGEYGPGADWPAGKTVIFDGYFMGFGYRKVQGKMQAVAHLQHWLIDLASSSCVTRNGHVANPAQLNAAAVLDAPPGAGGAAAYTSIDAIAQLVSTEVQNDLWGSIKDMFCRLADISTNPAGAVTNCEGTGDWLRNDRALAALSRMEGGTVCPFADPDGDPAAYGTPLALLTVPDVVAEAIRQAIADQTVDSFAGHSFWHKLVGQFCPMFGMTVLPLVRRALVAADLPAYRGGVWKTIGQHETDGVDVHGMLEYPLRGVGVVADFDTDTGVGTEGPGGQPLPVFGGCYVEQSVDPNDGILLTVESPPWLRVAHQSPAYAAAASAGTLGQDLQPFYARFAHLVYVNNALRGRTGVLPGKLRFDIGPGSLVRIEQRAERFIGAEDDLAVSLIAHVARVSLAINAEAPAAATVFQLSHVRREDPENREDRTSAAEHPLFGDSIHGGGRHGAPLIPKYDL